MRILYLWYYKQANYLFICVQKLQIEALFFFLIKHDKHLNECYHKSNWIESLVVFTHITITKFQITVLQFYKLWQLSSQPLMNTQHLQTRKWPHGTVLFLPNVLPAFKWECAHSSQIIQCAFVWTVRVLADVTAKPMNCLAAARNTELNSHSLPPSLHPLLLHDH